MRRSGILVLALVSVAAFAGCGGEPARDGNVITHDDMLADLKRLLEEYSKAKQGAAPKKLADVEPFEPSFPAACHALSTGKCVYVWGAGLGSGTAVLAYKAETPAEGGPVLLQNGEVKQMTADEFKAAPKAK